MVKVGELAQVPFQGAPDALHRVVVGAVAGAVEQLDPAVSSQPALDGPAGVRADAGEHDGDGRDRGVGEQICSRNSMKVVLLARSAIQ